MVDGFVEGCIVWSDYAIVAAGEGGVRVYDHLSDSPRLIRTVNPGGPTMDVHVYGNLLAVSFRMSASACTLFRTIKRGCARFPPIRSLYQ
ncbi:MAG: hypothetical protein HC888_17065 [Candidatus Competibacteraceae bacterium]|nr:hypothetical protein [Candidatus Competibacteraceae bacterium]